MGLYKFVRSLDIFESPVGVRYREDSSYTTFCGGSLSIIAWIIIFFFSSTEIWNYIRGNNYNESVVLETLDYDNAVEYNVTDYQAMVAFQLVATDLAKKNQFKGVDVIEEVSQYLKFYFLYTEKLNNTKTFTKIPAILCQEKYEDAPEDILNQFKKTDTY